MALSPGARLGQHEIIGAIGAGGMGEVFRARDTRLDRDVAIKVLPAELAQDRERLARFEREARLLASLNHPNIAHVYGFEAATLPDGSTAYFLAMELVEGEDLAQRLARGSIPVDDSIAVARQIAEGLEEAHEHGIIHRDLKPANIKVTPGGKVKILDFGLAKALEGDPSKSGANPQLSHSPTMSRHMTEAGMIMGTAAYMSPEQARGKALDKRADIWAFGVVLFEMLTGSRLFAGETVSDTLAAVLKTEPDWKSLPVGTPRSVRRILRHCLERDPARRLRDIGDARFEFDVADEATSSAAPPGRRSPARVAAVSVALALAGAGAFAALWFGPGAKAPQSGGVARFDLTLPPGLAVLDSNRGAIAIAPDHRAIVIAARDATSQRLYIRWLDRTDFQPIPGTEDATAPFFSPDGRFVGFFAKGQLLKASLANGTLSEITKADDNNGASWAPDGTIVFAPGYSTGLARVPSTGGEAQPLTTRDAAASEAGHGWPDILPDGEHVLYTIEYTGKPFDEAAIAVASLRTGKSKILLRGGSSGRYSPSGHILYTKGDRLLAAPFDAGRLEIAGEATTVLEGVGAEVGRGRAHFAMSGKGDLVYVPGSANDYPRQLSWATREGALTPASESPRAFIAPSLSPDGRRVLLALQGSDDDLWMLDLDRDIPTRLTFGTENASPVWAPDGKRFLWASDRNGAFNLYLGSLDNPSAVERLTKSPANQDSGNWMPDGSLVVYTQEDPATLGDIWAVEINGGRKSRAIVKTAFDERYPALSPDGRWLAYVSDESGRGQVYVQPFPGPGAKRQISDRGVSTASGAAPNAYATLRWSRDGHELFYMGDTRLMAVPIQFEGGLNSAPPRALFENPDISGFDVSPDGRRFLLVRNLKREPLTRLVLALGAATEIGDSQKARR